MAETLIIHRQFDGEHELTETCWCQPIITDTDDLRDADDIVAETERCQG